MVRKVLGVTSSREYLKVNLKRLRKKRGLTQDVVAEALGLSVRGYQKYEQGEAWPGAEMFDSLARVLKCNASDLIAAGEAVFRLTPSEAQIIDLVRHDKTLSKHDQLELNRLRASAPDLWEAWPKVKRERWRRGVALFFLTKDERFLDEYLPEKAREILLKALRFFELHRPRPRKK